jgi:hypothetical protein
MLMRGVAEMQSAHLTLARGTPLAYTPQRASGKRDGLRTIYYWAAEEHVCYMLYVYAKNDQGDLTPAQAKALARLVREEFK